MAGKRASTATTSKSRKTRQNPTVSPMYKGIDKVNVHNMPEITKASGSQGVFPPPSPTDSIDLEEKFDGENTEPTLTDEQLKTMSMQYVKGLDGPEDDNLPDTKIADGEEPVYIDVPNTDKRIEEDMPEIEDVNEDESSPSKEDRQVYSTPKKVTKTGEKRKRSKSAEKSPESKRHKAQRLQTQKDSKKKSKATKKVIRRVKKGGLSKTKYTKEEEDKVREVSKKKHDIMKDLKGWNCSMTEQELSAVSDYLGLNPHKKTIDMAVFVDGYRQHAANSGKQRDLALKKITDRQATVLKDQEEQLRRLTRLVESLSSNVPVVAKAKIGITGLERPKALAAKETSSKRVSNDPEPSGLKKNESRKDFSLGQTKKKSFLPEADESLDSKFIKYANLCQMDLDDLTNYGGVAVVKEDIVKICEAMQSDWEKLAAGKIVSGSIRQDIYGKLTNVRALRNASKSAENPRAEEPIDTEEKKEDKQRTPKKKARKVEEPKRERKSVQSEIKRKGKKKIEEEPASEDEEDDEDLYEYEEVEITDDSDSMDISGSEEEGSGDEEDGSSSG